MDLLEAGPTPRKGVGTQGKQKEGDLLKPREERGKDPPGLAVGLGQQQPLALSKEVGTRTPSSGPVYPTGLGIVIWVLGGRCLSLCFPSDIWQ